MATNATDGLSRRKHRWYLMAPLAVLVGAGVSMSGGIAHADPGGTLQVTVVDLHGAPTDGVCLEVIVPDKKNSPDQVVTTTAPSGTDGTTGHITQANIPAGSYIGKYFDCGSATPFPAFYTGATYNKANATPFGINDSTTTNLGVQRLHAAGSAGSLEGNVLDGSRPGSGIPDLSVSAYTAAGSALLSQTCTDTNGHYVLFELPASVKVDFAKTKTCSNDTNFVPQWYGGGTTAATATAIAITPSGDTVANDTSLALVTKPAISVTSVTFGGTAANPVVTVNGSGFGKKAPKPNPTDRPCGEDDVAGSGYDYGNAIVFWDFGDGAGYQVGFPGDCIGVNFVSYSNTQIAFTFNDWYREPGNVGRFMEVGDPFTLRIKGAPITGAIASIG
jgi:hypothetical protein